MEEVEILAVSKKNKSARIKYPGGREEWVEGSEEQISSLEKGQKVLIETQGKKIKKLVKKLEENEEEEKGKSAEERIRKIREEKVRIAALNLAVKILEKREKYEAEEVVRIAKLLENYIKRGE
jgi:hypothetical protein